MQTLTRLKLFILIILCFLIYSPNGFSDIIYERPPVEKQKPKSKKNRFNKKRKFKIKCKEKSFVKKSDDSNWVVSFIFSVFFILSIIAGAFILGFGAIILVWGIGIAFLLLGTLGIPLLMILYVHTDFSGDPWSLFMLYYIQILMSGIVGITFFIYGLVISFSIFWILGIILIALILLSYLILKLTWTLESMF